MPRAERQPDYLDWDVADFEASIRGGTHAKKPRATRRLPG